MHARRSPLAVTAVASITAAAVVCVRRHPRIRCMIHVWQHVWQMSQTQACVCQHSRVSRLYHAGAGALRSRSHRSARQSCLQQLASTYGETKRRSVAGRSKSCGMGCSFLFATNSGPACLPLRPCAIPVSRTAPQRQGTASSVGMGPFEGSGLWWCDAGHEVVVEAEEGKGGGRGGRPSRLRARTRISPF